MLTISLVNGVAYGSLLFLLAAGFSMIFGVLKVVNIAHGAYFLVGAHVAITVFEHGGGIFGAAVAAAAVGALLGAICERALLFRLPGDYLAQVLVTVGILLILGDLSQAIWGGTPRILSLPSQLVYLVPIGAFSYPGDRLGLIAIGAVVAICLWWATERTLWGAMVRASVDDEETAQAVGIGAPGLRLAVFAIGGLLAGFSGALGAGFVGARPGLDLEVFLLALVIVVVGGPGSLVGAYIAALLVGIIDSVGKAFWPDAASFLLFAPMAAFLAFRPSGLLGVPVAIVAPARQGAAQSRFGYFWASFFGLFDRTPRHLWPIVWALAGLCAPFIAPPYLTSIISLALIWSIFAMGLNILLGYAGMPSLGHAVFFGTGAYAVAFAGRYLHFDAWAALCLAGLAAFVMGVVIGAIALRTRHVQLLLATVALSQTVWAIVFKWRSLTHGDDGMSVGLSIGTPGTLHFNSTTRIYFVVAAVFAVVAAALWWFDRSRLRLVFNGLRDNERRLSALGYNTWLYRLGAFALSGTISGLGGGLYSYYAGFVSPELLNVYTSAKVLLMVVIGGAGTIFGPVLGAFALVFLEEVLSGWTERWFTVAGFIYIAVAMLTRGGLVGTLRAGRRAGTSYRAALP